LTSSSSSSSSSSDVPAVQITNGSFAWDAGSQPVLSDITLAVPKRSLVIVVGPVGSGKSSLLAAVLGEIAAVGQQQQHDEEEGQQQQQLQQQSPVTVAGTVAYTAQVRECCAVLWMPLAVVPSCRCCYVEGNA
jgi:ABC-type Mn2+/Zn2+ transport system ATPase subunit